VQIDIESVAQSFAQARRSAGAFAEYPGSAPQSMAEAYLVQDRIVGLIGHPIGGWKVGRVPALQAAILGADRLAGPIFSDFVLHVPENVVPEVPIYHHGFAAAEAEFMFRICTAPMPDKLTYTLAEAATMVDRLCVGIEMASSPFAGINEHGAAVTASDLGNTKALVIGTALDLVVDADYANWTVKTEIDGVVMGQAQARDLPDGPLGAVRFLLENLAARGIALTVGQWISSGAITGVHPVRPGQYIVARFGETKLVQCTVGVGLPL